MGREGVGSSGSKSGRAHIARYEVPSMFQEKLGLWVSGVGFHRRNLSKKPMNRRLESYAAVLVSKGRGWFESKSTGRKVIRAGSLFFLFPGLRHSYSPDPDTTWAERWVLFGGQMVKEFEAQGFLSRQHPIIDVGDDEEVAGIFSNLERVFLQEGPLTVAQASGFVHQLMVTAHGIATGLIEGEGIDPIVAGALRVIELESAQELKPESLAMRMHVGYSTLRRRFKEQTGYSVKEYILSVRLKRAKEKLAFSSLSIEKIAYSTGFQDPFYFSRIFQRREGMPPSVFRKQEGRAHLE